MDDGKMTVAEAARRLGISPEAVRQAIHRRRLRARVERRMVEARRMLLDVAEVDRYAAECAARRQAAGE
jgi:excisionase family DNA binding protein